MSAGCDVSCVESADECVLRASDRDGDGSLSAACTSEPGNDCDDVEVTAYPGAAEVCDGLDNDCNGLGDLADGHALAGTTVAPIHAVRIDLAWSPALDGFGMALGTFVDSEYALEYAALTKAGELGEPVRLVPGTALNSPRILWTGDRFGILSREGACSEPAGDDCVGRRAILELLAGGQTTSFLELGTSSEYPRDFGHLEGDWAFSLVSDGRVYAGRIDPITGISLSPPLSADDAVAENPRLAVDDERVAVAWRLGTSGIAWSVLSGALAPTALHEISTTAIGGMDFGSTPQGYAFAWNVEGGVAFQRSDSDGIPVCEAAFAPVGDHLSTGASVALADSPNGTLVLAVGGGGRSLGLVRFGPKCELLDRTMVVAEGEAIVNPDIAVGDGAVALGWSAAAEGSSEAAFYRVLGGNLCDDTATRLR